jgi:hypothetical protein
LPFPHTFGTLKGSRTPREGLARAKLALPHALRPKPRRGEQPTEVLIAPAVLDQKQQRRPAGQRDVGADDRTHPGAARRREEAGGPVDPVPIGERQRVRTPVGGRGDQIFRKRRAFEKAEGGATAQLDIIRHESSLNICSGVGKDQFHLMSISSM